MEGVPGGHEAGGALATMRTSVAVRLRPTGVRSAYSVVDRGVVSLALAWQGLWILADPRLWPNHQPNAVAGIAISVSLLTWLGLLIVHAFGVTAFRWWARWADVAALYAATLAVLWASSQEVAPTWGAASSMAVLPAALPGLLFGARIAAVWLSAVIFAELAAIFAVFAPRASDPVVVADLLFPAYALSVGVLTITARLGVTQDARRADAAVMGVERAEQERLTIEGVEAAVRREERLLHETVLNTLTAVLRGGVATTPSLRRRLRERCAESAEVLRDLRQRSERGLVEPSAEQQLDRDLSGSLVDLYTAGVTVHLDCDPMGEVPVEVYAAMRTASREALSNVLRHANARTVWISGSVRQARDGFSVAVDIRDDGAGFDPSAEPDRFGLRGAVIEGIEDVGGSTRIISSTSDGTRIELRWRSLVPGRPSGTTAFRPSAARFAIPVLASWGLFTTAVVILTSGQVHQPLANAIAFALLIGLSLLVLWASLRGPLPWWVLLVVAGVSPLIYQLQGRAVAPGTGEPWADWSSAAIVALFVVAAATGPAWGWLVLLVTWVFIQGDVVRELVAPGTAILLAAALYGRSTRTNAAEVDRLRAQETAERAAVSVAREGVHRLHRRYGALRESRAAELLEGIAAGTLDPDEPTTRAAAALEERFVRTVIRVDPAMDAVHALATSLAVRARRRGLFLDIDLADSGVAHAPGVVASKESLSRAVECSEPGGVARLSARTEGDLFVIRLLTPIIRGKREEMVHLAVPGVVLDPADLDMLWEIREPVATGS